MTGADPEDPFYADLPLQDDFAALADTGQYTPLPDAWWVGTSDIAGSTQAVAEGLYKTVNMVAAAVVSAQINAHKGAGFPYIFGGDGAGFAVPPGWKERAAKALSAVRVWAREEFGMELRTGMVRVSDIRAAGRKIAVARFKAARGVDYAMFAGGGLNWAEERMKAGAHSLPGAPPGTRPDLTGLSCRWGHMPSRHGCVLSVILLPTGSATNRAFSRVAKAVVNLAARLDRGGHPVCEDGPDMHWPVRGASLEARAQARPDSRRAAQRKVLLESLLCWLLVKTGLQFGGFDARRYRRVTGQNADFRKFDDGLKMTLDCDPETERRLRTLLEKAEADGILRFGLHSQAEAMMTCIVPSVMTDDHIHFVDGADGGYTAAAKTIKALRG